MLDPLWFSFPGFSCCSCLLASLEDSGYLARAALIADRTMRAWTTRQIVHSSVIGTLALCRQSMSTRTIENKRDRIATILIAPFMTCSARLPVYALLIAAFLPMAPVLGRLLGTQAVALLGLYVSDFWRPLRQRTCSNPPF